MPGENSIGMGSVAVLIVLVLVRCSGTRTPRAGDDPGPRP